ncbi:MAG: formylglycine-generating enzyme family protein [Bacteroidota bacterium]
MYKTLLIIFLSFTISTGFAQQKMSLEMITIEGGTFKMGCTSKQYQCKEDEKPVHQVKVNDFQLSKYEITNAQFCEFLNDIEANPGGSYYGYEYIDIGDDNCDIIYRNKEFLVKKDKENHPVIEVTWYGAKAFCHWADGRLPTEAEWEYAARSGNTENRYIYSGSDTLKTAGWFKQNYYTSENSEKFKYRKGTLPVGQKAPNALGLYDMSGNVWEYCNDWYQQNYYEESPFNNPAGPDYSNHRVIRGGSYKDEANKCRVSARNKILPGYSKEDVGFRLCRDKKQ